MKNSLAKDFVTTYEIRTNHCFNASPLPKNPQTFLWKIKWIMTWSWGCDGRWGTEKALTLVCDTWPWTGVGTHPWMRGSSVSHIGLFWPCITTAFLKRGALESGGCLFFPYDCKCQTYCETGLWGSFTWGLMPGMLHSFLLFWLGQFRCHVCVSRYFSVSSVFLFCA